MHLHDRVGGPTGCDKFSHMWLPEVAIVPNVRVSTVAMVLLKRTAVPHAALVRLVSQISGNVGVAGLVELSMQYETTTGK